MHLAATVWHKRPEALSEAIRAMRLEFGQDLPQEYTDFLAWSNGGEGRLGVQPYALCLDSAEDVLHSWKHGSYRQDFPGFLVIGSNGGGEYIAFEIKTPPPWRVVALDMTNIDLSETVMLIAKNFAGLLELIAEPHADA